MGPRVTWKMKLLPAGAKSNFDAALIGLDLSSSNVPIDSTSGYVTVSLDLIDGPTVSNSFQWINIGDELVAANPSAVNTWVSQYIEEVEEIDTNLNFTTGSIPGGNLVVTEVEYAGVNHGGSSTSWYGGGGGSGGCGGGHCEIE